MCMNYTVVFRFASLQKKIFKKNYIFIVLTVDQFSFYYSDQNVLAVYFIWIHTIPFIFNEWNHKATSSNLLSHKNILQRWIDFRKKPFWECAPRVLVTCLTFDHKFNLITEAIMKWKPGLEEKELELLMAEVLKHAPSAHSKSLKVSLNERGICNRYPSR